MVVQRQYKIEREGRLELHVIHVHYIILDQSQRHSQLWCHPQARYKRGPHQIAREVVDWWGDCEVCGWQCKQVNVWDSRSDHHGKLMYMFSIFAVKSESHLLTLSDFSPPMLPKNTIDFLWGHHHHPKRASEQKPVWLHQGAKEAGHQAHPSHIRWRDGSQVRGGCVGCAAEQWDWTVTWWRLC